MGGDRFALPKRVAWSAEAVTHAAVIGRLEEHFRTEKHREFSNGTLRSGGASILLRIGCLLLRNLSKDSEHFLG